jgi:hypothetical protein
MFPLFFTAIVSAVHPAVWRAEGRAEAERDIATGTMKWKVHGHMAGFSLRDEAARVKLRRRFGIELEAVAQCVVTTELVERSAGYNERIREEVERAHGAGAVSEVWKEAREDARPVNVAKRWALNAAGAFAGVFLLRRIVARVRNRHWPRGK